MDIIERIVKKHSRKFSLFLIIGILKTILTIGLSWLIIDILGIQSLLGSTIVVTTVFFFTYVSYVMAKVIRPRFLRYSSITITFNVITILLIWFFVDFVGFSGAVSSTIVVAILFILRYIFFEKTGVICHE